MSHPGIVLASVSAVVAAAVVAVVVLAGRGSERRASCRTALIPAYLSADGVAALVRSPHRPQTVIVNPHNGPGSLEHPAYRRAVREVRATGTHVLGYVPTGYGTRPLQDAIADVDRYRHWYGVDGIFVDEAASGPAQLGYYRTLAQVIRRGPGREVVLNPGTVPARPYFRLADVVVTYEGPYASYARTVDAMPRWVPSGRSAHLVYAATREQALRAVGGGRAAYVYVTTGTPPNPWRTVPPYLREEEEVLASCS